MSHRLLKLPLSNTARKNCNCPQGTLILQLQASRSTARAEEFQVEWIASRCHVPLRAQIVDVETNQPTEICTEKNVEEQGIDQHDDPALSGNQWILLCYAMNSQGIQSDFERRLLCSSQKLSATLNHC